MGAAPKTIEHSVCPKGCTQRRCCLQSGTTGDPGDPRSEIWTVWQRREDVEAVLRRDLGDIGNWRVSITNTNVRKQKVVMIEIGKKAAFRLLSQSMKKIGWVYCQIRSRAQVPQCFRSHGYGIWLVDCWTHWCCPCCCWWGGGSWLLQLQAVEWGMEHNDSRGKYILDVAAHTGLAVLNVGNMMTFPVFR